MHEAAAREAERSAQPAPPSRAEAFKFWLKLGFISFGGPAGQIALLHQELVERRHWISERRFMHAVNYCMLLPGPEGQQLATYMGWLLHRTWGGIVAGSLFVLPSLAILVSLAWLYVVAGDVPIVQGIFYGIKPAVVAIVVHAAVRIGSRVLSNVWLWMIAAASFIATFALDVPFPAIVAVAASIGFVGGRWKPERFMATSSHASTRASQRPSLIDDDTPVPSHAQFTWPRLLRVVSAGVMLWVIPMSALWLAFGWVHPWTQMGWFFTKAALLTFGGAYAVLPYVYQGAVEHYRWLTPGQMMDGLALGETTPGPLIMVVTFVAFVGAYAHPALSPAGSFVDGAIAAVVVTWFTFLPSILLILAGGPVVESTRGNLSFTAPLTAITAAAVGLILNLAVFFSYHVLWPDGFGNRIDLVSLAISAAAAVALIGLKRPVTHVILACGMVGLLITLLW
ncbi:MAG: chromate efflux transporter [Pseudoxanthomonas sp.]|nr:chromate efflux transporter [Pseudoxanthomonas sp.]